MITSKQILAIIQEPDEAKRKEMLDALPKRELEALLKDTEKLHAEADAIRAEGQRILSGK